VSAFPPWRGVFDVIADSDRRALFAPVLAIPTLPLRHTLFRYRYHHHHHHHRHAHRSHYRKAQEEVSNSVNTP
jgi:hypothetical protein